MANNNYTVMSEEAIRYICGLIKNIVSLPSEIISNTNLSDNLTFSNIHIKDLVDQCLIDAKDYADLICGSLIKLTCEKTTVQPTLDNSQINVIYLYSADGNAPFQQYLKISETELIDMGSTTISLTNYLTATQIASAYVKQIDFETLTTSFNNLVTSVEKKIDKDKIATVLDDTVTDEQVPSAKAVYDGLENINDFSVQVIKNNLNLNNITETGIYFFSRIYTPVNIPVGVSGWLLVMKGSYSDIVKQVWYALDATNSNSCNTFERYIAGDTWSEWTKFLTETELKGSIEEINGNLLGEKADKSYVDDNFATMDRVKDGYAKIIKNNDTDTNDAMFIAYKNRDLFGIRIYKDDNSEHELRFATSGISYVKNGVAVWTTSVADVGVDVTTITPINSNITGNIEYTVKNGICYVSMKDLMSTISSTKLLISTTMPKPSINYTASSVNAGGVIATIYIDKNTTNLYGNFYTKNAKSDCSFSYPVAES